MNDISFNIIGFGDPRVIPQTTSCTIACGDGIIDGANTCNGNPVDILPGFTYYVCRLTVFEECDDNDIITGNGCDNFCRV